jgi:hypothetical protein
MDGNSKHEKGGEFVTYARAHDLAILEGRGRLLEAVGRARFDRRAGAYDVAFKVGSVGRCLQMPEPSWSWQLCSR